MWYGQDTLAGCMDNIKVCYTYSQEVKESFLTVYFIHESIFCMPDTKAETQIPDNHYP